MRLHVLISFQFQFPTATWTLDKTPTRDILSSDKWPGTPLAGPHYNWGVLPYLGYTGTCRWTGYDFLASLSQTEYTIWLPSVLNRFKTCPKQGMVLRPERLKPRLRAVSFFSSPAIWALREVCDWEVDKRSVYFPDFHNINWVNRPLPGHYNVINQHQIIFWTRMLLLSVS